MEDCIFEGRAVWTSKTNNIDAAWAQVNETELNRISLNIQRRGMIDGAVSLTASQAKRLADHLYFIADRIEDRLEKKAA